MLGYRLMARIETLRGSLVLLCLMAFCACSDPAQELAVTTPTQADLQPFVDGKTDQFGFNPEHIVDDALFLDSRYLTAEQIQTFLEDSPYGRRSFLADYTVDGVSTAQHLVRAAENYRINPLVLLVKLQVEASLVYAETPPSRFHVDHAMGCGCPDGDPTCRYAPKGLFPQIDCAARLFREYMDQLDADGRTLTGWGPGIEKMTSEQQPITPRTKGTAALYTYTPWVLRGQGGNWLYWNVSRRFSAQLTRDLENHRWIGGPCRNNGDCAFEGGFCSTTLLLTDSATGFCTRACDSICPDSMQPNTGVTRCIAGAEFGEPATVGLCTIQCSNSESHLDRGCIEGQVCREAARADDSTSTRMACVLGESSADVDDVDDSDPEELPQPHDG